MDNISDFRLSKHVVQQSRRRGLSADDVRTVLEHGIEVRQQGRWAFFMTAAIAENIGVAATRLIGTVVVVSDEGVIITTFRTKGMKGLRKWREYNQKRPHKPR